MLHSQSNIIDSVGAPSPVKDYGGGGMVGNGNGGFPPLPNGTNKYGNGKNGGITAGGGIHEDQTPGGEGIVFIYKTF